MRVPSSINPNTFKTYQLNEAVAKQYEKKKLQSFNFKWDEKIPKTLHELCIESIASNWIENPVLDEIPILEDRYMLLDILPTNLPLELTVPKIRDDIYWRKCYIEKWPNHIPYNVAEVVEGPIEIVKNNDYIKVLKSTNGSSLDSNGQPGTEANSKNVSRKSFISTDRRKSVGVQSHTSSRKSSTMLSEILGRKTWKHFYVEKHVKHYLEELRPEEYDPQKIKDLSDLFGTYIEVLEINQMQCSKTSSAKIPLNAVLTGFQNLTELSLCFKQRYVGEAFSWNVLNTSVQDVRLLAKGLEKIRLKVLRIKNSDIDCDKTILIIKALAKHEIKILDFTHCKIGDKGFLAISHYTMEKSVEELRLSNNRTGVKGLTSLIYALHHENCKLVLLDLRLNLIFEECGNLLFRTLEHHGKSLKYLFVSGCGFNESSVIAKMLARNTSLEILDVSNNNIGEKVGDEIFIALHNNFTIKKLDLRMCRIRSDTELKIQELVHQNSSGKRKSKLDEDQSIAKSEEEAIIWDDNLIKEIETILE